MNSIDKMVDAIAEKQWFDPNLSRDRMQKELDLNARIRPDLVLKDIAIAGGFHVLVKGSVFKPSVYNPIPRDGYSYHLNGYMAWSIAGGWRTCNYVNNSASNHRTHKDLISALIFLKFGVTA